MEVKKWRKKKAKSGKKRRAKKSGKRKSGKHAKIQLYFSFCFVLNHDLAFRKTAPSGFKPLMIEITKAKKGLQ